ncbi:hypothetical protein HELRODRAFT_171631 [Helobdella robusta]|uniref:Uncharacterized protein n=1 Tax=Helobdella robusta TaxID=6412 RepID=T1F4H4_HELRO|nr:hypothetical protein HELRODRAFT_171631 [Helobdella robusta]ESO05271.1 hypothetical protein HELRODRAFT_171631 [Helobdella robusta]
MSNSLKPLRPWEQNVFNVRKVLRPVAAWPGRWQSPRLSRPVQVGKITVAEEIGLAIIIIEIIIDGKEVSEGVQIVGGDLTTGASHCQQSDTSSQSNTSYLPPPEFSGSTKKSYNGNNGMVQTTLFDVPSPYAGWKIFMTDEVYSATSEVTNKIETFLKYVRKNKHLWNLVKCFFYTVM